MSEAQSRPQEAHKSLKSINVHIAYINKDISGFSPQIFDVNQADRLLRVRIEHAQISLYV